MSELISLKQAMITTGLRDLGEFTVKSNAIRFSDPCYNNDTWCKGTMPAVNGKWQARLGFFRDSYDEKSLKDGIVIEAKAFEIVEALTYAANTELGTMYAELDKYVKDNRPEAIPFDIMKLTDITRPIVEDIVQFANEKIKPHSWRTAEESALSTLLDILGLVLGKSWRIPDRLSYRFAMLEFKRENSNMTDEEMFESAKSILTSSLVDMLQKSKKAFDEGRPRRVQFLHIKHESIPEFTSFEQEIWIDHQGFDVGVDSGQAGFFDEAWYAEVHNGDHHYDMLCNLSLGEYEYDPETGERVEYNYAGTFEFGCNGQTAHGDGSAPLYYRTDADGNVIEAVYHYDITYEEDEDEELEKTSDSEG